MHIVPSDPRILVMGRTALRCGDLRMGFPGTSLRFAYRGPAPTVLLGANTPDCSFNLACNGWEPVVLRLPEGTCAVPLPSGPAPVSGWMVEVVRRNENWQGIATFRGLELPPGCELLAPAPFPPRKLLFIGDSITCGEKIDRLPPEYGQSPRLSNAPRSYGMLLGRWLNAQVHLVSCGGRGLIRNWQGKTSDVTAPQFFQRAMPDEAETSWNHGSYGPDAVLIGLGTNDLKTGLLDEAALVEAYDRFLDTIRQVHPRAAILLLESPVFGETPGAEDYEKRVYLRRCLDALVARRSLAGDARLVVVPLHHYPGTATDRHPVAFQHEQIALEVMPVLRSFTGW